MIAEFEAFLKMRGKGPKSLNRELAGIGWTPRQIIAKSRGDVPLTDVDRLALTAFALGLPPFSEEVARQIAGGEALPGNDAVPAKPSRHDRGDAHDALV